jgi:hypothetical protein
MPQLERQRQMSISRLPENWRSFLAVHPAAKAFPLLSEKELAELAEDIERNGLRADFVLWRPDDKTEPVLIDGRNRLDALDQIGQLDVSQRQLCIKRADGSLRQVKSFHTIVGGDPAKHADSLNLWRRHLSAEKKRELIAKVIKTAPEKSDRQIAETVKADHKTVGAVRAEQEARGEIPHVENRTDTKGRRQPAKRAAPITRVSRPAPHQPAHISQEAGEQVGTIAAKLVELDVGLARELARILLQPGVPTRLWHDLTALLDHSGSAGGTDPGTPAKATNALGMPLSPQFDPNWKRKTKLTSISRLRAPQKGLHMTDAAATGIEAEENRSSAETMKAKFAEMDGGGATSGETEKPPKRGRGRPKGSRNKPKPPVGAGRAP